MGVMHPFLSVPEKIWILKLSAKTHPYLQISAMVLQSAWAISHAVSLEGHSIWYVLPAVQNITASTTHSLLMTIATKRNRCSHSLTSLWPQNDTPYLVFKEHAAAKLFSQLSADLGWYPFSAHHAYWMSCEKMWINTASVFGHFQNNDIWFKLLICISFHDSYCKTKRVLLNSEGTSWCHLETLKC